MSFRVVIPARFDSSRLPGKALLPLAGKPMLQWVHERARASRAETVLIATDDERISTAALGFGAEVAMTARTHISGTDRIAEVAGASRLNGIGAREKYSARPVASQATFTLLGSARSAAFSIFAASVAMSARG